MEVSYTQINRPLQINTPLGIDTLLVIGFSGREEIGQLFAYKLELIAQRPSAIDFDKIIGQEITLTIATLGKNGQNEKRFLSGICSRFSQGSRNEEFTNYTAEMVPRLWLLSRQSQSRIFQQKSVPDILKEILQGLPCDYQLRGTYEKREYCVQYRETDYNFASRLMEDEGIYYFFRHNESGHTMVIADTPQSHPDVPGNKTLNYKPLEGGLQKGDDIFEWQKTQEVRASKYALWDHSFQQPKQNLEAKANILENVQIGSVRHGLKGNANSPLEIYDYPGGYALRFDGISPSGGEQADRLQKIFQENQRVVKLRMEAEAMQSLTIEGASGCSNLTVGHQFSLKRHFDADGDYVLVSVAHAAELIGAYRTGSQGAQLKYSNIFSCIPLQLPYRPLNRTPEPVMRGVQNALVTGPPGEEIFTDKYGRVKVQFYWDRQGRKDANSSCWLRVSTNWAGKQWGVMQVPRIGQEVIVAFLEGNPDEPVIVGSVFNPETMPPYSSGKGVVSGLKSNTHKGTGFNEVSLDDTAGKEKITIHAQYDMNTKVEHDLSETIKNNAKIEISEGTYKHDVKTSTADYHVKGALKEIYESTQNTTVTSDLTIKSTGGVITVSADSQYIDISAATRIVIHTGASKLDMRSDGSIELSGVNIGIKGSAKVYVKGGQVVSEADTNHEISGMAVKSEGSVTNTVKGGMVMLNP